MRPTLNESINKKNYNLKISNYWMVAYVVEEKV